MALLSEVLEINHWPPSQTIHFLALSYRFRCRGLIDHLVVDVDNAFFDRVLDDEMMDKRRFGLPYPINTTNGLHLDGRIKHRLG